MTKPDSPITAGEFRKLVESKAAERDLTGLSLLQLDRLQHILDRYTPGDEMALWAKYFEDGTPYEENANVQPV